MVPDACDTRLDQHQIQLRGNDHIYWGTQHASHVEAWYQWRLRVRDGHTIAAEVLSYPSDEYIRWYRGMTRVYIGNLANRDTRLHGYQPASVDRRMMHDIQQTFLVQSSRRRPREHVPDRSARVVKRGASRQPGRGADGGRPPVPPFPYRHEHVDPRYVEVERGEGSGGGQPTVDPFDNPNLDIPSFSLSLTPASQSLPSGSGTSQMSPPPGLGFASFQAPHSTSFGFSAPLLQAQPVHLHRISLYRRHLRLMKRSRRMT
ncbi:hypothetical protein M9H77_12304 [Catharanthus roseus]|uniref:Uncharacterized protein n=1 Tax=Catharanthus roseus TaxID=4058 RepID=A0ACC0BH37_CATRO|nr:hypothetical protein M9H77_12304 [Catharanthus roseus]